MFRQFYIHTDHDTVSTDNSLFKYVFLYIVDTQLNNSTNRPFTSKEIVQKYKDWAS